MLCIGAELCGAASSGAVPLCAMRGEGDCMQIRLYGVVDDSIVDGPGFRLAVFTQGCPHHCPGCHNPESHAMDGGKLRDTAEILAMMDDNPLLDGITLSGGEPFMQCEACRELGRAAHERGLNVWCFTGFLYEQLLERPEARALLDEVDVLVDGPFMLDERSLALRFRGSRNQRVIDMRRTREGGGIVLVEGV